LVAALTAIAFEVNSLPRWLRSLSIVLRICVWVIELNASVRCGCLDLPVENLWKTPVPSELQFYLNHVVAGILPQFQARYEFVSALIWCIVTLGGATYSLSERSERASSLPTSEARLTSQLPSSCSWW
jgi:hypothetical protein